MNMFPQKTIWTLIVIMVLSSYVYAANDSCVEPDLDIINSWESAKYIDLPADIKKLMDECKCDVKTGSNYDDGYILDLNDDGVDEYAFDCMEAPHGPGLMNIYGKVNGKWSVLLKNMLDFPPDEEPGSSFMILKSTSEGYHDICQYNELYKFKDGRYRKVN